MPFLEGRKGADPELFFPRNSVIMDTRGKKRFDRSLFTIGPSCWTSRLKREKAAWHTSDPKRYKIRITDPKAAGMSAKIDVVDPRTGNDLEAKEVSFRNNFRPRAR